MKLIKLYWWLRLNIERPLWRHVGRMSYVGRPTFATRTRSIVIGNKVRIYPNSRLECGPYGKITFGNNISVGPNVNITAYGDLKIDDNTTISANVFITDMDHDFSSLEESTMDRRNVVSKTFIGRSCFIGANSVILAGTTLERGCVVGANSTLRGKFDAFSVIAGSPAVVKSKRK